MRKRGRKAQTNGERETNRRFGEQRGSQLRLSRVFSLDPEFGGKIGPISQRQLRLDGPNHCRCYRSHVRAKNRSDFFSLYYF